MKVEISGLGAGDLSQLFDSAWRRSSGTGPTKPISFSVGPIRKSPALLQRLTRRRDNGCNRLTSAAIGRRSKQRGSPQCLTGEARMLPGRTAVM